MRGPSKKKSPHHVPPLRRSLRPLALVPPAPAAPGLPSPPAHAHAHTCHMPTANVAQVHAQMCLHFSAGSVLTPLHRARGRSTLPAQHPAHSVRLPLPSSLVITSLSLSQYFFSFSCSYIFSAMPATPNAGNRNKSEESDIKIETQYTMCRVSLRRDHQPSAISTGESPEPSGCPKRGQDGSSPG